MMKLIKKHAGGGWIDKGKAIWDYTDGPENIQKKIATYYTGYYLSEDNAAQVSDYLKSHTELARYLDQAYDKGVNWEGQKKLGNDPSRHTVNYRDSKGDMHITERGDNYARSLGYRNYVEFEEALKRAGFVTPVKGHLYTGKTYYLSETPTGLAFVDANKNAAKLDKAFLDKKAQEHAPISKAYHAWDKIAKQYRDTHNGSWFSSAMQKKSFRYDPRTGRYLSPDLMVEVRDNKISVSSRLGQHTYLTPEKFIEKYLE